MKKSGTDHRTRLTKFLIRRALLALMRKKPIQSISVKELCELAGINRGTFYAHYRDVYDLLSSIEEEMLQDLKATMQPVLESDPSSLAPVKVTSALFRCVQENADLCTVTLGDFGDKAFLNKLTALGRDFCLSTYAKHYKNASPRKIAIFYAFASSGCIGLLQNWLDDGMPVPAEEIARTAEEIMEKGAGFLE